MKVILGVLAIGIAMVLALKILIAVGASPWIQGIAILIQIALLVGWIAVWFAAEKQRERNHLRDICFRQDVRHRALWRFTRTAARQWRQLVRAQLRP